MVLKAAGPRPALQPVECALSGPHSQASRPSPWGGEDRPCSSSAQLFLPEEGVCFDSGLPVEPYPAPWTVLLTEEAHFSFLQLPFLRCKCFSLSEVKEQSL